MDGDASVILSGQTIQRLGILSPFEERTERFMSCGRRVSHGLSSAGYDLRVNWDEGGVVPEVRMRRGEFRLASTLERFRMPDNVVGVVHDKSSWARRGLAVQNTVIEPGWEGYLTLELTYHGKERRLVIPRAVGIAQVVFHQTDERVERPYDGKYQNQGFGPKGAR